MRTVPERLLLRGGYVRVDRAAELVQAASDRVLKRISDQGLELLPLLRIDPRMRSIRWPRRTSRGRGRLDTETDLHGSCVRFEAFCASEGRDGRNKASQAAASQLLSGNDLDVVRGGQPAP